MGSIGGFPRRIAPPGSTFAFADGLLAVELEPVSFDTQVVGYFHDVLPSSVSEWGRRPADENRQPGKPRPFFVLSVKGQESLRKHPAPANRILLN
jgi:hypothetical protein